MSVGAERLFAVEQTQLSSDDYYTPKWVFDRMGIEFDLDVSAPPGGVPWVPAKRFLTVADDGLATPWRGRVWMNPPFSHPSPWVDKFVAHRDGVCLLPFAKSAWFDRAWRAVDAVVAPGVAASRFVGGPIFMPVWLGAFGVECVEAIGRLGIARVASD